IGNGRGQPMPVMFETRSNLEKWACQNNHSLTPICFTNKKKPNAYILLGDDDAINWYRGTFFLWVKANWKGYRKAFEIWLDQNRSGDSLEYLHDCAIETYKSAINLIKAGVIFKKRTPQEVKKIINLIAAQILPHEKNLNFDASNISGEELFAPFDYTLDGDHVVNKSSLKDLSDAWVLMAPVHADANRGFGCRVERNYPRYKQGTGVLELDPSMAFKLFASFMPTNPKELEEAMGFVGRQMGPLGELDDVIEEMYIQMKSHLA
ncbi:hypothetical protein, partial [Pseudomonas syringae]|uniref:hypothetical protein n=1 Tax=Pseudomonas syringae TaxID=317 RepID=UPI001F48EC68